MTNPEPDKQINDSWTVGGLIDEFEDHDFLPTNPDEDHFECDFCSKGVAYKSNPRVGGYVADNVLNTNHPKWQAALRQGGRPIVPLASYCEECSTRLLLFPCEGFAEVRTFFDLDEDMVMRNVEITDLSGRDDGISWDPKELMEEISGVPFEEERLLAAMMGQDHLWGPENMVTVFLSTVGGVDIRELVKWDGSLDPKLLGQARRKYEDFQKKMQKHGHSRRAFRDHVRGDN